MKEERLYIVGYMACGKTTLGAALARRCGRNFVDLDSLIEAEEGRSPARIIAEDGEQAFRLIESRALKSTAAMNNVIVACGGGTPCWRDNMEFMTLHGLTLWLIASPERMAERIEEAGATRPLAAAGPGELPAFIEAHLRERQLFYARAQWRLSGENLETPAEIEATASRALELIPHLKTQAPESL